MLCRLNPHVEQLMTSIGKTLSTLHLAQIIHGDLTTSNMMLRPAPTRPEGYEIVLIDFGLSSHSNVPENLAVDLYVLERAFASTHPTSERWYQGVSLRSGRERWGLRYGSKVGS
jgi:TP53 regulating kinase-like protein